jgi:hypothetical protein
MSLRRFAVNWLSATGLGRKSLERGSVVLASLLTPRLEQSTLSILAR